MEQTPTQPWEERMTAEEWRKTHKDFKTTRNDQHYVLRWTDKGTCLVPVVIVKKESQK